MCLLRGCHVSPKEGRVLEQLRVYNIHKWCQLYFMISHEKINNAFTMVFNLSNIYNPSAISKRKRNIACMVYPPSHTSKAWGTWCITLCLSYGGPSWHTKPSWIIGLHRIPCRMKARAHQLLPSRTFELHCPLCEASTTWNLWNSPKLLKYISWQNQASMQKCFSVYTKFSMYGNFLVENTRKLATRESYCKLYKKMVQTWPSIVTPKSWVDFIQVRIVL